MFSRRDFIKSAAVTACASVLSASQVFANQTDKKRRPNIVLFVADDLGMQVGCYGDSYARTPHLDELAGQGVRFETAYVTQSSCSPSRSSILTGLYPHQNGQIGLANRGYSMDKAYPSIPTLLKKAGYRTAITGKLHVEPESAFDFDLKLLDVESNMNKRDVKTIVAQTDEFIKQSDQPFFIYFNAIDPHRPFSNQLCGLPEKPQSPDEVMTLPFIGIDDPSPRSEAVGYYNSCTRADIALGLLIDFLRKTGNYENTLIIAIGDNGPPFTRGKTTCYEAGLRTPFIIRWGSKFEAGSVRDEMISTVDIMPTILEAAGVEAPAGLPGKSVIGLLTGTSHQWRNYLCGEHTAHQNFAVYPRRAIRDQRFKLIHNLFVGKPNPVKGVDGCLAYKLVMEGKSIPEYIKQAYQTYTAPPEFELYDLQTDPDEFRNLADVPFYNETLARLKNALLQWQKDTNDPLLDEKKLEELKNSKQTSVSQKKE